MRTDFHAILRNHAPALRRDERVRMSWDEARAYYYSHKSDWSSERSRDKRQTVCVTGFTSAEKADIERAAAIKSLRVVDQVNMGLHLLVCGPNAGPKKLEKASAQGVAVILEADF